MSYVGASTTPSGCVFCDVLSGSDDRKSLVLARRDRAFLILNLFPYAPGHLMAVVNRHVGTLADATPDEIASAMELVTLATRILTMEYRAEGFNVGLNQGRGAGPGLGDHPAAAHGAAVERRPQLHPGHGRRTRHPGSARGDVRPAEGAARWLSARTSHR